MLLPGLYIIFQNIVIRVSDTVNDYTLEALKSPFVPSSHIFNHKLTFYKGNKKQISEFDFDISSSHMSLDKDTYTQYIFKAYHSFTSLYENYSHQDLIDYCKNCMDSKLIHISIGTVLNFNLPVSYANLYKDDLYTKVATVLKVDKVLYDMTRDYLDYLFQNNKFDPTHTLFSRKVHTVTFRGVNVET